MRKIVLGGMLLLSVISCSDGATVQDEAVSQETSMNINLNSERTSLTGKDVKRGTLPVTVNSVVIKATPVDVAKLPSIFNFNIVSDNNVSASDGFEIRNFSTGISKFSVTANSGTNGEEYVYGFWAGESSTLSVNDLFIKWAAKSVAVNYITNVQTIDVKAGINTPVSFTLLPTNGRVISVFQLSDELKGWNYKVKVQTKYDGGSGTGFVDVDKTHNGVTHLDGYYTYRGAPLKHIITIFDDKGEKVAEYGVVVDITNGESTNTIYTILSDQIPAANKLQTTILVPDFKSSEPTVKQI
ncbi:hypothetical protein [Flavobacterium sp. HJJ]|uniref:hypothetical protein n=1 Tax=Flavobacterium sp. HJJ TaxID=2783792 RepID=UPI00188A0159|nr:hypothetical protein [Flavobacterium sp. HJJ]MBF4473427.1 hypothetical protein [Flavobacterium sp. HJJ]